MSLSDWAVTFGLAAVGYLLGSVPFGVLIGRIHLVDVRTLGSGNIGSTNVGRVLGRGWGYLCFLLDVGKGFGPVMLAGRYVDAIGQSNGATIGPLAQMAWLIVGASCILGHVFSLYLGFTGGKGVATSLGVLLGIWPYFTLAALIALAVWVAVWGAWRYVSLASIVAAAAFPVGFLVLICRIDGWHFGRLWLLLVFGCVMAALVIVRHRSNISRLLAGTENRRSKRGGLV